MTQPGLPNCTYTTIHFAKSNGGPTTLPAQIEDIRARLVGSPYLDVFESKLLNTGYNDADKEEYKASYTLSYEEAFIVNADFPKITKETVMPAVLDASYIVDLNVCDNNIITYNSFMEKLKTNRYGRIHRQIHRRSSGKGQ